MILQNRISCLFTLSVQNIRTEHETVNKGDFAELNAPESKYLGKKQSPPIEQAYSIYLEGILHRFGQVYFYFIFDARMKGTM